MKDGLLLSVRARATLLAIFLWIEVIVIENTAFTHGVVEAAQAVMAQSVAWVLRACGLDAAIDGITISLSPGSVQVTDKCVGLDIGLFMATAMWFFPTTLRAKLLGSAASLVVFFGLNWLRVLVLAALVHLHRPTFDFTHVYVWPGVMILVCVTVFLLWRRALPGASRAVAGVS